MYGNSQQLSSKTTIKQNIRNTESNSKTVLIPVNPLWYLMAELYSTSLKCTLYPHLSFSTNFGLAPYVLQVKPIEISLFKDLKKSSVFKTYDLNVAGMAFSYLKKAGGSKFL